LAAELASKASHYDMVKNPDVARFLDGCDYLKEPSDEEVKSLATMFQEPAPFAGAMPERVIAIDGSDHESSISDRLPHTRVGYVKVGCVLIDMSQFGALRVLDGRYVDPFKVAELQENNSPITFTLPSANIRWAGKATVRDGFRAALDDQLQGVPTRFNPNDRKTSLRTTLFQLASRRAGDLGTNDPSRLKLHKCPDCGNGPVELEDIEEQQRCPSCNGEVYPSDCLRLWEEIQDYQSNIEALTRFMMQVEHMMPVHYLRYLAGQSLPLVSSGALAFFVDGPLAVFGNGAWLHAAILRYLGDLNTKLAQTGRSPVLMIGLQKSGQVCDHLALIDRFLPNDRLLALNDDYRYRYVLSGRDPSSNGFGSETYYGQDFIYKTPSGRVFVLGLPYPFASKADAGANFPDAKCEVARYPTLPAALALIRNFESDLYENAVIPIALAHRYTAIRLMPGGKVLDLLTKKGLQLDNG
jgi:hypothetical protein